MFAILIVVHLFICIGLIITVLMQSAKGEGLAGAFGGGALSGAVFGGRGAATFLSRATTGLAIAFMVSCIVLTFMSRGESGVTSATQSESAVQKVVGEEQPVQQQPQQVNPAATGQQPAQGAAEDGDG